MNIEEGESLQDTKEKGYNETQSVPIAVYSPQQTYLTPTLEYLHITSQEEGKYLSTCLVSHGVGTFQSILDLNSDHLKRQKREQMEGPRCEVVKETGS